LNANAGNDDDDPALDRAGDVLPLAAWRFGLGVDPRDPDHGSNFGLVVPRVN